MKKKPTKKFRKIVRTTFIDRLLLFIGGAGVLAMIVAFMREGYWFLLLFPFVVAWFLLGNGFARVCNGRTNIVPYAPFKECLTDIRMTEPKNNVLKILKSRFGIWLGYAQKTYSIIGAFSDSTRFSLYWPDGAIVQLQLYKRDNHSNIGGLLQVLSVNGDKDDQERAEAELVGLLENSATLVDEGGFQKAEIPKFSSPSELKMKLQMAQ